MKRLFLLAGIFVLFATLSACASKSAPPEKVDVTEAPAKESRVAGKATWELEWEKSLVEGKKEGKVTIYTGFAPQPKQELGKVFKDKYGISIEWVSGTGSIITEKVMRERKAGIFLANPACSLVSTMDNENIVMLNPSRPGPSARWNSAVAHMIMNWDFIEKLVKQLELAEDSRLVAEYVAKGKYSIALAPEAGIVIDFMEAGAPLAFINPKEGVYETTGQNNVSLLRDRPHPYASRLFLNWFLSKEGQSIVARTDLRQTSRLDIPEEILRQLPDAKKRQPGVKYFNTETEEFMAKEEESLKKIKEIYGSLTR